MQHAAHYDQGRRGVLTNFLQLDVGPLRIRLRTEAPPAMDYSAPAYAAFCSKGAPRPGPEPLVELAMNVRPEPSTVPARPPSWQVGRSWAVWEEGADLLFRAGMHGAAKAFFGCRVARDLTRAELSVDPDLPGSLPGRMEAPLRYPLDQAISWGLLSRIGGALLHSAVAVKKGRGVVFAGRSGAGKSTISGLLRAEGWRILNDDRVVVFRRGGEWRVAGTPWHGSGRFAEAAEVPLAGICFLHQASACRLEPMSASQTRLALLDVAAVPWFEDGWAQGTLDGIDRLAKDVGTSRFHFTKTPEAAATVEGAQEFQRSGVCA